MTNDQEPLRHRPNIAGTAANREDSAGQQPGSSEVHGERKLATAQKHVIDAKPAMTTPQNPAMTCLKNGANRGEPHREPSREQIRRWRRYLAEERMERATYLDLARRRKDEENTILMALADAESRHEKYWLDRLGEHAEPAPRAPLNARILASLARKFGSIFVLALAQRAEQRQAYDEDSDATAQMAADEHIHGEVVRGLAARSRERMSGMFRAGVFGANDGLVSNLALILGIAATGTSHGMVVAAGTAGLLAGALSMAAGEYISVTSQRELLEASDPAPHTRHAIASLDIHANELELVFRARGESAQQAAIHARELLSALENSRRFANHDEDVAAGSTGTGSPQVVEGEDVAAGSTGTGSPQVVEGEDVAAGSTGTGSPQVVEGEDVAAGSTGDESVAMRLLTTGTANGVEGPSHAEVGTAWSAAASSFLFFALGAFLPLLPFLLGLSGTTGVLAASVIVGFALIITGGVVGILSGKPPLLRGLRQLAVGYGAAGLTYLLGLVFGATGVG